MVYKHAISTIVPTRAVRLNAANSETEEEDAIGSDISDTVVINYQNNY